MKNIIRKMFKHPKDGREMFNPKKHYMTAAALERIMNELFYKSVKSMKYGSSIRVKGLGLLTMKTDGDKRKVELTSQWHDKDKI